MKITNDILDTVGKNNNFINDTKFSEEYKELAKKWSKLPLYTDKDKIKEFFNLLENKQVILLVSGTGSGKTVLVPKFVMKYIYDKGMSGKIAVTNPKILTTKYNAEYGAKTLDIKLGDEVGYKYKGSEMVSPKTRLIYVTDGLILATILNGDILLKDYDCVIIDEAHERHLQIDILLKMLKEVIYKRPEFRLIIMSATINSQVFRDYFKSNSKDKIEYGEIEVSGQSNYDITQHFLGAKEKINRSNYVQFAVERCIKIIESEKPGDIIVFIATTNDAITGCELLKSSCPTKLHKPDICNGTFCVEVYSKMRPANKELAVDKDLYKKNTKFNRKVIFATNVAESSITFDGLVYVIDSGYELANYYDVKENSNVITKAYTSQAQIKQRIGRAGRTQPGISYHLYSSMKDFKNFPEPNISVSDLTDFILSFIKYSKTIKNMIDIVKDLITVPSIIQVTSALQKLHFLNCIKIVNPKNKLLTNDKIPWDIFNSFDQISSYLNGSDTKIGYNVLKFRSATIPVALGIMMSKYMNCFDEMIKIMAIIDISEGKIDNLFKFTKKQLPELVSYFNKYGVNGSDHLTILNIYNSFDQSNEKTESSDLDTESSVTESSVTSSATKKIKFIDEKQFNMIKSRIKELKGYSKRINEESYKYMKDKYKIVNREPYDNLNDNILYCLAKSHHHNLLRQIRGEIYTSIYFLNNSEANILYSAVTPSKNQSNQSKYCICNSLNNLFGKKNFNCISIIPTNIIKDIEK
jgi:HrpA-like RNA helicase